VGDLDRLGLGSLLRLVGIGHSMRDTLFYGEEGVITVRDKHFHKILSYPLKQYFRVSPFVNSNILH
jgi:hypothetical protein